MHELNMILKQRRQKAEELAAMDVPLYANDFKPSHRIADVLPQGDKISVIDGSIEDGFSCKVAGRIIAMRKFGKAAFIHIQDESGRIQAYIKKDRLGDDLYAQFKKWDIGDIAGFKGTLFKTKTGELTILAHDIKLITKALRPLPEKFHGLTDVEVRYRQRYVDLIVNTEVRDTFKKRVEIIRLIREYLANRGFMEVETPMMQTIPGGATAKPFQTHHNALNMDLFLRIAPELYLKRLLVGGFEKVFEINRNFRNEGLSTRHNPEFTMLEFYQAYATYFDMMDLTEEMVSWLSLEVNGSMEITYQGRTVDMTPPWKRYTMDEALIEVAGIAPAILQDAAAIMQLAGEKGIELGPSAGPGKAKTELFELLVEEKLINPTFVTAYPTEVSPLARRNKENPQVTDRFELFITGREIANAFSELNDPIDQKKRLEKQIADRGEDEEIYPVLDDDFVRALEYGLPAAAGEGIGIDRLVMLFTDAPSIRDVILFPLLKPEKKDRAWKINMRYEWFVSLRYLRAKRKQGFISLISLISVAGVCVGVMALIVVLAVMTGFTDALRAKILGINSHIIVQQIGGVMSDYRQLQPVVGKVDGVIASTPYIYTQTMLTGGRGGVTGAVVRGIDPSSASRVIALADQLTAGSLGALNGKAAGEGLPGIILGKELARQLGVGVDDSVRLFSPAGPLTPMGVIPQIKTCRVVGIFESGMFEYDSSLAYVSIVTAQKFLDLGDMVHGLEIKVNDIYQAMRIAGRIENALGAGYVAKDWISMNKNLFSALKLEKTAMFIVLVLIVLVAAFNIISTLTMVVMEKGKDIAILKSMGASSASILRIFIYEGLVVGVGGTVLGLAGGLLLCELLSRYQFIKLPGDVYPMTTLPIKVLPMDVSLIAVSAVLITLLATLYPSWQASRIEPAVALRYE